MRVSMPILKKVLLKITFLFTCYYLLSLSSFIFLKTKKKFHLQNPFIKDEFPSNSFSFFSMFLNRFFVFLKQNNSSKIIIEKREKSGFFFSFSFPTFLGIQTGNIRKLKTRDREKKTQISFE